MFGHVVSLYDAQLYEWVPGYTPWWIFVYAHQMDRSGCFPEKRKCCSIEQSWWLDISLRVNLSLLCPKTTREGSLLWSVNVTIKRSPPIYSGTHPSDSQPQIQESSLLVLVFIILLSDTVECASNPCRHVGTCIDRVNGYTCTCFSGYADGTCGTGKLYIAISDNSNNNNNNNSKCV